MVTPQVPGMDPWIILPQEYGRFQQQFQTLGPVNGVITGNQAKGFLLQSQLPPPILGQIWGLSDTDSDGKMNIMEFSIACKLINLKLRGFEVPASLPPSMIQSLRALSAGSPAAAPAAPQPLIGVTAQSMVSPPSNGVVPQIARPPPPVAASALRQNRQTVAASPLASTTIHTSSKPPARPAPPSIGASFVATTGGPPPKPAPPSFPNSPVMGMSPEVKPPTATAMGGMPPVVPIAPLNTAPAPIAAFGMAQPIPAGAVPTGVVPPMSAIPGVPPVIPAIPQPVISPLMATVPDGGIGQIPMGVVSPVAAGVPTNGSAIHTPVSTSTPLSTTARPPSIDRMSSIESQHSQHSASSPQFEWSVPHQCKLKYTQLFNTWDRQRTGFLSGPQARNIMVQSQLPQPILAKIWALSDMDSDGRLGCEEFVLAMHLCEMVKAGETLPAALPLDLIPPTFRRQRQSSLTPSIGAQEAADPAAGMPQSSFEDKRRENYEKGQAELDRRRKSLLEIQRKEQEERERKEREEADKQEKIRLEQERRRQAEIEKQMMRQKEIEQQKDEERKRAQEQRESARKEMERQRQLEWERQKSQELESQRQKEQDLLLKLKAKNQGLTIELGTLNDKVKELSQKICDTRVGVSSVKTTIDGMRSTRDTQLQEMSALKNKLREQNQRLLAVTQEKARIEAKNKMNAAQDSAGQEAVRMAFANKQITLKQMKDKIADMQEQINEKMSDIENNNGQLEDIKGQMKKLVDDCKTLYVTFDDRKMQVLELRNAANTGAAWGDDAWGSSATEASEWPVDDEPAVEEDTSGGAVKYRALYEFVARNQDEISFQPGDIIMVPPVQNAEPGWMAGEIRGHTGWFPESYVEPVDAVSSSTAVFAQQDSIEKRTLEGIAEVPENVSDAGSLGEGPAVEPIVPTLGMGEACNAEAITLFQYRPTTAEHLAFEKDETITVLEQQENWWYGESKSGNAGWFPNSYVRLSEPANGTEEASFPSEGLNEYYVALYSYAPAEAGDLNFNQGEVVLVIKKEGDWWTGVIGDRTGIFPSNYVEKCDAPQSTTDSNTAMDEAAQRLKRTSIDTKAAAAEAAAITARQLEDERQAAEDAELPDFAAMAAQAKGKKPEIVQVIAPYQTTSAEQLSLQKGQLIMIRKKTDSGWWEGELQARGKKRQIGWFPATYVKPLTSSSNRSTPVSHSYMESPTDPNTEKVMALYPYQAQNEDELSFDKGDVINVLSKDEAAWWKGELNGASGVFPSNYVSPMS